MSLSAKLTYLRKEADLTQEELSEKLKISRSAYSHYESGLHDPPISILVLFADFYGVSIDYLLDRTITRKPYPR